MTMLSNKTQSLEYGTIFEDDIVGVIFIANDNLYPYNVNFKVEKVQTKITPIMTTKLQITDHKMGWGELLRSNCLALPPSKIILNNDYFWVCPRIDLEDFFQILSISANIFSFSFCKLNAD